MGLHYSLMACCFFFFQDINKQINNNWNNLSNNNWRKGSIKVIVSRTSVASRYHDLSPNNQMSCPIRLEETFQRNSRISYFFRHFWAKNSLSNCNKFSFHISMSSLLFSQMVSCVLPFVQLFQQLLSINLPPWSSKCVT